MKIKELTLKEFEEFSKNHMLKNYHQSPYYAMLMAEYGFDYEYIGYVDSSNNILAASLILYKKLSAFKYYGYAPCGFLIDYFNKPLLKSFTESLKKYCRKSHRNIVFIKINPEIVIGQIDYKHRYKINYNQNVEIINNLKNLGYDVCERTLRFESLLPKFNAIKPLKNFDHNAVEKNVRNKVNKAIKKGLSFYKGNRDDLDTLYNFIKGKTFRGENYYRYYYNIFSKDDLIDLFLVKLDYNAFLQNAQENYQNELENNAIYNENILSDNSQKALNKKMQSDLLLTKYKNDIVEATKPFSNKKNEEIIAGALVVKYENRINIITSGINPKFKRFNPNQFLFYKILDYYKKDYIFADLNGITGDFNPKNTYFGLNEFKFDFKPKAYEFIGEFNLVINESSYVLLKSSNKLSKKFKKDNLKK